MCAIRSSFNILSFSFFANILILIILTDSKIKIFCYMRPCGVNFDNSENLRFLRGTKGGFPQKNSNSFYEKSNNRITCVQGKKHHN